MSSPTSPIQDKGQSKKECSDELEINEAEKVIEEDIKRKLSLSPPLQYVTRQDSGVPEDLMSPCNKELLSNCEQDDNVDCNNMTVIQITETLTENNKDNKDGSDSGVEGCTIEIVRTNGYSSSCNGLDQVSCDSSLLSCYEEPCGLNVVGSNSSPSVDGVVSSRSRRGGGGGGGEATSEGGSESSSVTGSNTSIRSSKKQQPINLGTSTCKKKSIKVETPVKNSRDRSLQTNNDTSHRLSTNSRSKSRTPTPKIVPKSQPTNATRERAKSRDKSNLSISQDSTDLNKESLGKSCASTGAIRTRTRTRPNPPDLLTLSSTSPLAKELDKDLAQRGRGINLQLSRCSSTISRGRNTPTPSSTPSEECRKPLSISKINSKPLRKSIYQENKKLNDVKIMDNNKTLDAYATLPRRNKTKMSVVKLDKNLSRDTSLNRNSDKVRKKLNNNSNLTIHKSLPPYPKFKQHEKTLIYHEISVQTGLTGQDIENFMIGIPTKLNGPDVADCVDFESQTDELIVSQDDLKKALEEIKNMSIEMGNLKGEKSKLELKLSTTERLLTEERTEHTITRQELQNNAQRILAILGTPASDNSDNNNDSLLELESHFQESGQMVANQQLKIADLQSLCHMLNRDLEKSLAAQKILLQHQQQVESETMELQEFLQLEKTAMAEAMKDVENELERKTEECKHLVRISEQRYQENLSLEMKLNAIERKSKELFLTQNAAMSTAGVALSALGSRLEGLIQQLVKSYKISEKDLEDVVYHNEAYSKSNSSTESSPLHSLKDSTPSPKRNTFVSAVISAIRNATTHPFVLRPTGKKSTELSKQHQQLFKDFSMESSADLLDFETEPCLMMESVLEDVPLTDTYSRNMVSSSDSLRRALSVPEPITLDSTTASTLYKLTDESSSLTNLTQAILNRRRAEENEGEDDDEDDCESISESEATGHTDLTIPNNDLITGVNLVDQVIDVDNLVTKLLKVLRIIQLDNDTCIRELRDEKFELEGKLAVETNQLNQLKNSNDSAEDSQWISIDNTRKLSLKESEMTTF